MASPDLRFDGRVAVVTGAAHGIGRAIAVELARRGATVFASDVLEQDLGEVAAACAAAGGSCHAVGADVTDEGRVAALAAVAGQVHGAVDILVNVAGGVLGQVGRPLEEVSPAAWQEIVDVNLTGAFLCARAMAPG
ncbi:MAG: SDR family NAD(P)-dependent oxidoreductase, partial [Candidatus Dormibacteraeota bacterium]|nr:SDR family NAD(P)-dependent oxidoreductase [Candidatus Dormibacteraeota bacterium]